MAFGKTKTEVSAARASADKGRDNCTLICSGSKISGKITSSCDMNVEGEVEGVIQIDGCLTVAPGGRVRSESLSCRDARIAGSVEGPLTVYQTLLIASGGAVAGDIAVGELLIEQGGSFDGTCRKLKAEELPSSRVAEPVEASKRHDPAPKPGQKPDTAESGKQTREISSPT